jgi:hypothetical protein
MKRTSFTRSRTALAAGIVASAFALGASAEDLSKVKITFDKDVAARTNMQRPDGDTSTLGVSFDQDVANRTNMGRQPGDVGTVTTAPDMALRERTNMGGIALQPAAPAKAAAALPAAPTKAQ